MLCSICHQVMADGIKYCPHCGMLTTQPPSISEPVVGSPSAAPMQQEPETFRSQSCAYETAAPISRAQETMSAHASVPFGAPLTPPSFAPPAPVMAPATAPIGYSAPSFVSPQNRQVWQPPKKSTDAVWYNTPQAPQPYSPLSYAAPAVSHTTANATTPYAAGLVAPELSTARLTGLFLLLFLPVVGWIVFACIAFSGQASSQMKNIGRAGFVASVSVWIVLMIAALILLVGTPNGLNAILDVFR